MRLTGLDLGVAAHLEPSGVVQVPVPENVATGDLGLDIKQKDATQPDQVPPA
jgi:hypothetical protein